jgi:fibrillarin-like pre-rRNA processing protein
MKILETDVKNMFWIDKEGKKILTTRNLTPGITYYKENTFKTEIGELREWIPYKSKLAAAISKGLEPTFMNKINKILYLGLSTGTTASHISDIIAGEGVIYGVEISPRVMLEFISRVAKYRDNIVPLFFDARIPENYMDIIDAPVDMIYCDVAQPDQTRIAIINSKIFLKRGGILLYAIKARSIDATLEPKKIYLLEERKLEEEGFKVEKTLDLEPYEKDHMIILARYE